jgi:hypothetical protein
MGGSDGTKIACHPFSRNIYLQNCKPSLDTTVTTILYKDLLKEAEAEIQVVTLVLS